MSLSVDWALLVIATLVSLWMSLRFRDGPAGAGVRIARMTRRLAGIYRSVDQPAVIRNLPVVMPVIACGALPAVLLIAPMALSITSSIVLAKWALNLIALGGIAYVFLVTGGSLALLYRPPAWLTPSWLAEEDGRLGYPAPRAGWFDRLFLLIGVLFVVGGVI